MHLGKIYSKADLILFAWANILNLMNCLNEACSNIHPLQASVRIPESSDMYSDDTDMQMTHHMPRIHRKHEYKINNSKKTNEQQQG